MIIRTNLTPGAVARIQTPGRRPRRKGEPVAAVRPQVCEAQGRSKTHPTRLRVLLTGNGRYQGNSGQYGAVGRDRPAALYEEYGDWLAALYALDGAAIAGPYRSAEDFAAKTHHAFPVPGQPEWTDVSVTGARAWRVGERGPSAWVNPNSGRIHYQAHSGAFVMTLDPKRAVDRNHMARCLPVPVAEALMAAYADLAAATV